VPARLHEFRRLVIGAALLPAMVLAAMAGVLLWQVLYLQDLNDQEKVSDAVVARAGRMERLHVEADADLRGFLLTGDRSLLQPFEEARREQPAAIAALRELVAGFPSQRERVERLDALAHRWYAHAATTLRAGESGGLAEAAARISEGEAILEELRALVRAMEGEEEGRRASRNLDARELTRRTVVSGGLLALVLMSVVAYSAVRQMQRAAVLFGGAVRARDEFISVASHELKTPLTSLQLQVQLLARQLGQVARDGPAEGTARRLAVVEQSARRLGELVDRLLDVSRLGTGPLELSREPLDLAAVVEECAARLRDRFEAKGSALLVAAQPAPGEWDRHRLESVVTNLLDNALKYGEGRPVEVRVEASGGAARLTVRDQGIGIAAEHQGRIFERYERAASGPTYEGLGVGLWLVRAIVEAHGGAIRVESEPGTGAIFAVTLPQGLEQQQAELALR